METLERHRSGISTKYLGKHFNKVDSKGRLSIPADFRKVVEKEAGEDAQLLCFPAFKGPFIDCGGPGLVSILIDMISNHDHFDEDREVLEIAVTSGVQPIGFDDTGRISLPKEMREYAGLSSQVAVIGIGDRFQLWNRDDYDAFMERTSIIKRDHKDIFRARSLPSFTGRGGDRE